MRVLVVAKAPVAGRVKTRLASAIGSPAAAEVAAAALLDTMDAATAAVGPERCVLSLDGDLADATRGREIRESLAGWTVVPQRGAGFAERLANAHDDAGTGPVIQIAMDTPQVTPLHLLRVSADLDGHDAVLGAAGDGGWWVLARRDPRVSRALAGVAMSEPTTYVDTFAALAEAAPPGGGVGTTTELRDVDTVADAHVVAAMAPRTRFAAVWRERARAVS
jgi:glycosyltransferase A (GT-A) superfamily protein (DUF2064 family)